MFLELFENEFEFSGIILKMMPENLLLKTTFFSKKVFRCQASFFGKVLHQI
jgi:hypothetical protein